MHTFFQGWRRKVGVATLVMACLAIGMQIRSATVVDVISIPFGAKRQTVIWSLDGSAHWFGINAVRPQWQLLTGREWSQELSQAVNQMQFVDRDPSMIFREWRIAYLPLAIFLTLLSAYLILWKPRRASPN